MLIDEPAVVVPRRLAGGLLTLAVAEMRRREERGRPVSDELRKLLRDLATVAAPISEFPGVSASCSARFRPEIVDGVNVQTAAQRLGVTERAIRYRCVNGQLPAVKQADGAWLIALPEEGS